MAQKIAVLSDTHGLLRPEVMEIINTCDAVIHAGDINKQQIVDQLQQSKPLYIVRGNNDREWAEHLPVFLRFQVEGLQFFLVHDKKDVPESLDGVDIVVFGHSHKYLQEEKGGRLWLNPGSCGKRRFTLPVTMAVMTVEHGNYHVERIDVR